MAGGWAPDGAEQAQIDANLDDALAAARRNLPSGESARAVVHCLPRRSGQTTAIPLRLQPARQQGQPAEIGYLKLMVS